MTPSQSRIAARRTGPEGSAHGTMGWRAGGLPGLLVIGLLLAGLLPAGATRWGQVEANDITLKAEPGAASTTSSATPLGESARPKAAKSTKGEPPVFTREREAAALEFVRLQHAELADLLDRLKVKHRLEYERAIRELFRASERLALLQERNPHRYETELQSWKLNSRIQVLIARLAMATDPQVEQELRAALAEQLELKRRHLQGERDRAAARLAEIDRELQQGESVTIDQRLQQLVQGTKERKKQRDSKAAELKSDGTKSDGGKADGKGSNSK